MTKKTQIIFSPQLARQLLKENYHIIDIQPNSTNPERTVFFFKNEEGLESIINKYQQDQQLNKINRTNNKKQATEPQHKSNTFKRERLESEW